MSHECIKRLSTSLLFRDIKFGEIEEILHYLKPIVKKYRKNEVISFAGQSNDGIGIIAKGKIAVTRESSSGNRVILDIMNTGDVLDESSVFSYSVKFPPTVITLENSCLFFFALDKLVGDCNDTNVCHNILMSNLLKILTNYNSLLNKKIDYLSIKNIREKLSIYLLDLYRRTGNSSLIIPMKRHELADYLNISRPALSRELCLMRTERIIDFNGCSVTIKDINSLEKYSNISVA
jgi:CRP-like cAMP-binding protein